MSSGQSSLSDRNPSVSSTALDGITQGDDAKHCRDFQCDRIITDATSMAVTVKWKGKNMGEPGYKVSVGFQLHFRQTENTPRSVREEVRK
jgi:hypothetical protein